MSSKDKEYYEALKQPRLQSGSLLYNIEVFGDYIAKKNGYKYHTGMDAIFWYIVEKYKWTPSVVRSLNSEDLRFLMVEEMSGWTLPPEAIV